MTDNRYREDVESLSTEQIHALLYDRPEAHGTERDGVYVPCRCNMCDMERDVLMDRGLGPRW